ncbi:MAG TPA: TIGR01777 family oxidoreductase [Saprospiraceae bacterium]|nr:TIGR01777 family oxidoreductase [Saprospiraceae bacterium]
MPRHILIAGGTGLIGTALKAEALALGWNVTLLSRTPGPGKIFWDPASNRIDLASKLHVDAIINLAGTSIGDQRWTISRKQDIVSSRLKSASTLYSYLQSGQLSTPVYIGISGIGIYRNSGSDPVDETAPVLFPEDWMVQTVQQWEKAHAQFDTPGIREVTLRMGLVMSPKGGALKELLKVSRFGMLTYFGSGKQYWSWIHIGDTIGIMMRAMQDEQMKGVYLCAAPHPVTNREFTRAMRQEFSFPRVMLGVPGFALRLILGELSSALLDSCNAFPKKLIDAGFEFKFPTIREAMHDLLHPEA